MFCKLLLSHNSLHKVFFIGTHLYVPALIYSCIYYSVMINKLSETCSICVTLLEMRCVLSIFRFSYPWKEICFLHLQHNRAYLFQYSVFWNERKFFNKITWLCHGAIFFFVYFFFFLVFSLFSSSCFYLIFYVSFFPSFYLSFSFLPSVSLN